MGFPGQEYWSGLPFPSPGDLPDPGIKTISPVLAGGFFTIEPPGKPNKSLIMFKIWVSVCMWMVSLPRMSVHLVLTADIY